VYSYRGGGTFTEFQYKYMNKEETINNILKEFDEKFERRFLCNKCRISYSFSCPCQLLKQDIKQFLKKSLNALEIKE